MAERLDLAAAQALLPRREEKSAKWMFGRAMLVCGSCSMPGAALLSAEGALRSGAGLVQLAAPESVLQAAAVRLPECLQLPLPHAGGFPGVIHKSAEKTILSNAKRADALLFGCGVGLSHHGDALLNAVLLHERQLVLDADGINLLSNDPQRLCQRGGDCILTPHLREFCRLTGLSAEEVSRGPEQLLPQVARYFHAVIALKGSATVLSDGQRVLVLDAPNSGMAKGGSGDVLAGLTAGLAAQMPQEPLNALALAVWLHSRAGMLARLERGARAMLPRDVLAQLPEAFLELEHPVL